VSGERQISKVILKNRGLVRHKAKINRNPRVKKREQYRKALIRRKGTVQEIRADEVHKYESDIYEVCSNLRLPHCNRILNLLILSIISFIFYEDWTLLVFELPLFSKLHMKLQTCPFNDLLLLYLTETKC